MLLIITLIVLIRFLEIKTTAASGYNSQLINAGKINNHGIEVQLDGNPIQTQNFKWNVAFKLFK